MKLRIVAAVGLIIGLGLLTAGSALLCEGTIRVMRRDPGEWPGTE